MEARFRPHFFFVEGKSVVNLSVEKRAWIQRIAGDARNAYGRLMRSGILVISCDNRADIEIVFPKAKFAHLCGFDYYWDVAKRRRAPQELFYDDIVSANFTYARADYSHRYSDRNVTVQKRRERTGTKVAIAADVFNNVGTATHVVESAKGDIVIFMGRTEWSLGLGHQKMKNGEESGRYIPTSLINDSVLSDRVHRSGTAVSTIVNLAWR